MLNCSDGRGLKGFYFSPPNETGGSIGTSNYHNPGGVLEISMPREGVALDLSPTKKPLNTQFDELLSPKNTYLIRGTDSAHQDLEAKLQQSLELLVTDSTYQKFIYPVLEKLTEMHVQIHDLMKVSNSASFDAIAEPMFAQTLYLELYEKRLFAHLCRWSGVETSGYDLQIQSLEDQLGIVHKIQSESSVSGADLDDLVNNILSGTNQPENVYGETVEEKSSIDNLSHEVRVAMCSIINHRLGNLPQVNGNIQTYFAIGSFGEASFAVDQERVTHEISAKLNHYKYLGLLISHASKAHFGPFVEWAQHRIPELH